MKRRDFLSVTSIAGAATLGGCARPRAERLFGGGAPGARQMARYVAQVDAGCALMERSKYSLPGIDLSVVSRDAQLCVLEPAARRALRSSYVYAMFDDLPLEGQIYPLMQKRMAHHAAELDDAISSMSGGLRAISATRLDAIGRAADANVARLAHERFQQEMRQAGVPARQRRRLLLTAEKLGAQIARAGMASVADGAVRRVSWLRDRNRSLVDARSAVERQLAGAFRQQQRVEQALAYWRARGVEAEGSWQHVRSNAKIAGGAMLLTLGLGGAGALIVAGATGNAGWMSCLCASIPVILVVSAALIGGAILIGKGV